MPAVHGLVVLLVAAVFAACGGSAPESGPGSPQTAIDAGDQALAETVLLRLEDLPSGWRENPARDDNGPGITSCPGFDLSDTTVTGRAVGSEFTSPVSGGASSAAVVLATEAEANIAFGVVESFDFGPCLRDLLARDPADDVELSELVARDLSFASLGQQSTAQQIEVTVEAQGVAATAYMDLVWIRQGRFLSVLFTYAVFTPVDTALEEDLAQLIETRLLNAQTALRVQG